MPTEAEIREAGRQVFIGRQLDRIASDRLPRPDVELVRRAMNTNPSGFVADPQTREITGDQARAIREAAGVPEREGRDGDGLPYRVYRRITPDGDTQRTMTVISTSPAGVRGVTLPASVMVEESVTRAGTFIGTTITQSTFWDGGSDITVKVRDQNNPRGNQTQIRLEPTQMRINTVSDGVGTPPFTVRDERIMEEGRRKLSSRSEGPRVGTQAIEVASVSLEQLGDVGVQPPLSTGPAGRGSGFTRTG